jgi:transcriptional regulator with PAS, ATPase and Fis domain
MASTVMIGCSESCRQIEYDIQCASRSDAKVLISGESGVGKEVLARLIHERSQRSRAPMVAINCASVPDSLLASELFGHMKGSFTDAHRSRTGLFEQAHRGTMFLDEVGEMSLQMQATVLRFLENGEILPVGSERVLTRVDVRIIAATNRTLSNSIKEGRFREDLYYRLNVIHIEIPPLRSRPDDVPLLLDAFLRRFAAEHGIDLPHLNDAARQRLLSYHWPGNVRELKNVAERLVVRHGGGEIELGHLPMELQARRSTTGAVQLAPTRVDGLIERLTEHRESFWSVVHEPFMARDLTRDDLRAIVRFGLTTTRGSYKSVLQVFNLPPHDYKKFLSFLRKYQVHLPIHEFRALPPTRTSVAPTAARELSVQ